MEEEKKNQEEVEKGKEPKSEEVAQKEQPKNEERLSEKKPEKEKKAKLQKTTQEKKSAKEPEKTQEEVSKQKNTQEEPPQKRMKRTFILTTIFAVLGFALLLFSIFFSVFNINNNRILKGISIMNVDVSELTIEEAKQKLEQIVTEKLEEDIVLKHNEEETLVDGNTFNTKFDIENAVIQAYNVGRDGNIITNNYGILSVKLWPRNMECKVYQDSELLETVLKDIGSKMADAVVQSSYYIEDKNLVISNGKPGYAIKKAELTEKILDEIKNVLSVHEYHEIEIPVEYKNPNPIDVEKIREEIYKEPKNAYVEKDPITVHPHVNGVDFAISMEEAKKIIEEPKEEYSIPLKITVPEKTIADLGEEAFPEQLATYSTRYDASNRNRSTNIELATKKVNGTVIMPGENFSFNTIVGKRTIEAGFKEGTAYIGGKVVPDVGGGICQLSSTLYNVALLANLEIVERSNHIFLTSYVPASRDATVYYGSLDMVFKNTRSYPIKIEASSQNGVCKVAFYGIKEKTEYEVIIQSKITSYINCTTEYKEDNTLEKGKEVIEQYGSNGCRSEAYRILKLGGKVVSQTLLSKDSYSPMQRIIRRGTKQVATPTTNNN